MDKEIIEILKKLKEHSKEDKNIKSIYLKIITHLMLSEANKGRIDYLDIRQVSSHFSVIAIPHRNKTSKMLPLPTELIEDIKTYTEEAGKKKFSINASKYNVKRMVKYMMSLPFLDEYSDFLSSQSANSLEQFLNISDEYNIDVIARESKDFGEISELAYSVFVEDVDPVPLQFGMFSLFSMSEYVKEINIIQNRFFDKLKS